MVYGPPPNAWVPADVGMATWNCDPADCDSSVALTSGVLYLAGVPIRASQVYSQIGIGVVTAGSGGSATCFAGIYSGPLSGTPGQLLASTTANNAKSAFTTGGYNLIPLITPVALTAGQWVWVAFLSNLASTQPSISRSGNNAAVANAMAAAASYRYATNGSGLSALPASITPSANSSNALVLHAALA